jgi:xanthine dehydrogenase accessory factor
MKEMLLAIRQVFQQKQDSVLVLIIKSSGSSPRKIGAAMLIAGEGRIFGTIGGGISEHLAEEEAKILLKEKHNAIKEYILHPNEKADIGAQCGGDVTVYFQFLDAANTALGDVFNAALETFTLPAAALRIEIAETANTAHITLLTDERAVQEGLSSFQGLSFFHCPIVSKGFVYIFGSGYVAQELCPLLTRLDYRCIIFDDRAALANKQFFPDAVKIIHGSYDSIGEYIDISENDCIVTVTRGPGFDFQTAAFALKTKARYIGLIGSKKKLKFIREKLKAKGFTDEQIDAPQVHAPIGLDIGSETPIEVAVSIAAELIKINRGPRYSKESS